MDKLIAVLKSLDVTTKQLFFSWIMNSPVCYLDCWILSQSFRSLDWYPQTILTLGLSFCFIILGYFLLFCYQILRKKNTNTDDKVRGISIILITVSFVLASVVLFLFYFFKGMVGRAAGEIFLLSYVILIAIEFIIILASPSKNDNGSNNIPN